MKASIETISEILFTYWDPIGVNYNDKLNNEYTDAAKYIMSSIDEGINLVKITEILTDFEIKYGVPPIDDSVKAIVANKIIDII